MFRQKREDLKLSCVTPAGAVEFRINAGGRAATFALPFEALKQCAGGSRQPVEFEVNDDQVISTWQENGSARTETINSGASDSFPRLPKEFRSNADLLPALCEAARTACREEARYALQYVQLQGKTGRVVATDAHQLFVQEGFDFPWDDDLLVPASGAFQCKELADQENAGIGRSKANVFITAGPWTLVLPIQQGRFPDASSLIPSDKQVKSRLRVTDADARFAIDQIPDLPCDDDLHETVTVDLNGEVLVRAAGGEQESPVELDLSGSSCSGKGLRFGTDRRFLRRALQFGFREVCFTGPQSPAFCRDGQRTYLWALLDGADVPSGNATRISSASDAPATTPKPRKTQPRMPNPSQSQNGSTNSEGGIDGLIDQAESMKSSLRETLNQVGTFISDLKRQKKQAKLVRTTLASLKQLQSLDA